MPKPKNQIASEPLRITTTGQVRKYLEQLVLGGLYGKNPAEAAGRLIERGIEDLIQRKQLLPVERHRDEGV
jgi:hypothetical protein